MYAHTHTHTYLLYVYKKLYIFCCKCIPCTSTLDIYHRERKLSSSLIFTCLREFMKCQGRAFLLRCVTTHNTAIVTRHY